MSSSSKRRPGDGRRTTSARPSQKLEFSSFFQHGDGRSGGLGRWGKTRTTKAAGNSVRGNPQMPTVLHLLALNGRWSCFMKRLRTFPEEGLVRTPNRYLIEAIHHYCPSNEHDANNDGHYHNSMLPAIHDDDDRIRSLSIVPHDSELAPIHVVLLVGPRGGESACTERDNTGNVGNTPGEEEDEENPSCLGVLKRYCRLVSSSSSPYDVTRLLIPDRGYTSLHLAVLVEKEHASWDVVDWLATHDRESISFVDSDGRNVFHMLVEKLGRSVYATSGFSGHRRGHGAFENLAAASVVRNMHCLLHHLHLSPSSSPSCSSSPSSVSSLALATRSFWGMTPLMQACDTRGMDSEGLEALYRARPPSDRDGVLECLQLLCVRNHGILRELLYSKPIPIEPLHGVDAPTTRCNPWGQSPLGSLLSSSSPTSHDISAPEAGAPPDHHIYADMGTLRGFRRSSDQHNDRRAMDRQVCLRNVAIVLGTVDRGVRSDGSGRGGSSSGGATDTAAPLHALLKLGPFPKQLFDAFLAFNPYYACQVLPDKQDQNDGEEIGEDPLNEINQEAEQDHEGQAKNAETLKNKSAQQHATTRTMDMMEPFAITQPHAKNAETPKNRSTQQQQTKRKTRIMEPFAVTTLRVMGNLPLHVAASMCGGGSDDKGAEQDVADHVDLWQWRIEVLLQLYPKGAATRNYEGKIPLELMIANRNISIQEDEPPRLAAAAAEEEEEDEEVHTGLKEKKNNNHPRRATPLTMTPDYTGICIDRSCTGVDRFHQKKGEQSSGGGGGDCRRRRRRHSACPSWKVVEPLLVAYPEGLTRALRVRAETKGISFSTQEREGSDSSSSCYPYEALYPFVFERLLDSGTAFPVFEILRTEELLMVRRPS